jgi:hypothetical protein
MSRWLWSVLFLFSFGLVHAEEGKAVAVPYKLTDTKHLMVRVKLNGKGPFNLIMDTGAPALFITKAVAEKAGVEAGKDGWGTVDRFELEGGLVINKAKGRIEDPFQLKGMNGMGLAGVEIHGMLGFNLLARYKITYDLTSDKLLFEPLQFDPPPVPSFGGGGQPGGLEILGSVMKMLGPLLGMNGPPPRKPRGLLGMNMEESDDGVVVKSVLLGSPADRAGLKPGDKISKFYQSKIDLVSDMVRLAGKKGAGDEIILTILRDNEPKKITLELGRGL